MRNPRYFQAESRSDRWLISYVDIVTILLILFVAAAAHAVQRASVPSPPPPPPAKISPLSAPQAPALMRAQEKLQKDGIDMTMEERGLVISLPQAALFASGQDEISPSAIPTISRIAEVLRDLPNKVNLIGHADSTPIHSQRFRNNWELSAARSLRLLEFLTGEYDISEERLTVASQGSYNPKNSNDTEDGRAANRRVEIVILSEVN